MMASSAQAAAITADRCTLTDVDGLHVNPSQDPKMGKAKRLIESNILREMDEMAGGAGSSNGTVMLTNSRQQPLRLSQGVLVYFARLKSDALIEAEEQSGFGEVVFPLRR